MNKRGISTLAIVIIAVAVIVAGYLIFSSSEKTGTLKLQITDAPSNLNISKAFVTISSIEVHKASTNSTNETNETNLITGWTTVVQGPISYDLIAIKDIKELLGSKELEPGKYTQIRLNVDSAKVTIDGNESSLTVPSDKIKLIHPFIIESGKTITLTLDFDADESVKSAGKDKYILQPTIKIVQE